jgi:hypothetical protein
MDMEMVKLADVSWFQAPRPQVFVMWTVPQASSDSPAKSRGSFVDYPQRVPVLNWPAALFDDVALIEAA